MELITVPGRSACEALYDVIRAKWAKLCSIRIHGSVMPGKEFESFLISYGHQLREVHCSCRCNCAFSELGMVSMCRIASQCPNLELFAQLESNFSYEDPMIRLLAPHDTDLELECKSEMNWEAFEHFANRLKKLKKLTCTGLAREALHALFVLPKPTLETLELRGPHPNLIVFQEVWKMKNLRHFSLSISGTKEVESWCTFLTRCSNLECFLVKCNFGARFSRKRGNSAANYCDRFLLALRECRKLHSISFDLNHHVRAKSETKFKSEVKSAQFFRFRPVRIEICGMEMFVSSVRAPSNRSITIQ